MNIYNYIIQVLVYSIPGMIIGSVVCFYIHNWFLFPVMFFSPYFLLCIIQNYFISIIISVLVDKLKKRCYFLVK